MKREIDVSRSRTSVNALSTAVRVESVLCGSALIGQSPVKAPSGGNPAFHLSVGFPVLWDGRLPTSRGPNGGDRLPFFLQ